MAAIGPGWVDGAWTEAGWATNAWSPSVGPSWAAGAWAGFGAGGDSTRITMAELTLEVGAMVDAEIEIVSVDAELGDRVEVDIDSSDGVEGF